MPSPGIETVPLMMPRLRPCPSAAEVERAGDDVVAAAARAEVGAAEALHAVCVRVPCRNCHWMPNSRGLVGGDLDDQRFDEHLRAAHVEPLDDRAQVVVHGSGPMMISALLAVSAWIVSAAGRVRRRSAAAAGERIAPTVARRRGRRAAVAACPACRVAAELVADRRRRATIDGATSLPPLINARSVCATRAASAFFRYTMNMLPPGRPGVSSCSISALHARGARRIVGAQHHAVRARIGDERHALLRFAGLRRGRGAGFGAEQAIDERHEVERRRVLQRHDHRLARRRLVERRDDLLDPPQVLGVVGDDRARSCRETRRSCCSA